MDHALSDFVIMGLITNQPFLRDIMNNDSYRKASFTTKFVDEEFSEWSLDLQSPVVAAAAMLASSSDNQKAVTESSRDPYSPWSRRGGWRQGV